MALTLGGLRMSFVPMTSDVAQYNNSGGLTIEGVVVGEPDVRDDKILLRLDAETITRAGETLTTSGIVLVQAPPTSVDVHYGDRIAATGQLITPAESDTFSYGDYLARGGVFSIMTDTAVEILSSGHGNPLLAALFDLKAQAQIVIARYLPEPNAALLTGILLGNARGIPPEVNDAFSKVGASHIVAISGFNMAIVSGVVMGLLGHFRVTPKWSALIGMMVLLVYTLLVGANASAVRAAIMCSMLVIGKLIRRKTYVPASLAFVALLMSLQNPTILWDVGFQLSFFAVLSLALFVDPVQKRMDRLLVRTFPRRTAQLVGDALAEPVVVTLAAQVMTLPLIVLYFGRLSLVSVIVNLLVIPVQAQLLVLGFVAMFTAVVLPALGQVLYWLDMILLAWTIGVVRAFARLPFADTEFHVDPRFIALFFGIVIGGALMQAAQPAWALSLGRWVRGRAVVTAVGFAGAGLFILMIAVLLSRPDGNLHVWMLDMGHSNAVLIQTPHGAHILVDGGHYPSRLLTALGERIPFNKRDLETLVITQPDEYEFGALTAVADRYAVGVILTNGQPNLSPAYQTLQDKLAGKAVVVVGAGYTLEADDGTRLEVLHPQSQPDVGDSLDTNAVTLRLSYGGVSFLLTSDLSQDGQTALLQAGQWPVATVLQLPKHGTVRSLAESFVKAVQPQAVVVQADPANRLGDPNPDTLSLIGTVPLFRTDTSGTIHLWTDGRSLWEQPDKS
jgi:competence protein ComEC